MKVLDVDSLMSGLEEGIRDIDDVHEKISAVQRSIRDFFAMEDALRGKGGDAIRYFFHEVHQPFLIFLYQSLQDYKTVLKKMQNSVEAFEPNPNGLIRQDFLENEVTDGFDKAKDRAMALTDDANGIIGSVQDLVAVDRIDDTAVLESVDRGKKKVRNIVEDLNALDKSQVQAMTSVRADLQTMKRYLADVEAKVERGDLSPDNFNFGVLRDVEGYSAMMEEIYGEEEWQVPREIAAKLANGKTLSPYEQDVLYDYFQNEFLNAGKRKEIEEIAGFINEKDIDKLTERLNDKVVISADALEDEMVMIQAYVFLGNHIPSETNVDYYDRSKLEAYLMLLKDLHTRMVDGDSVIQVGKLEYEKNHHNISGHFLESVIKQVEYNTSGDIMNKEEFHEWVFNDPDNYIMPRIESTAITYATGPQASTNIEENELENSKNEYANYEENFIVTNIVNKVVSELAKKANISGFVEAAKTVVGFDSEKKEMGGDIKVEEALKVADRLNLEMAISEQGNGKELNIQFYPLDGTFEKMERWKELHKENPNLYFPNKEINSHDWYAIGNELKKIQLDYGSKTYAYIYDGSENGESIEVLAKGEK
ncbi:LXG domain-containing protein [Virgibacillus sp. YIM 98842]|uniref:LXG domain-containing protein n=1 Tax=Virgibacillus sp. YIM 98842 TaxID=2663533 RepID=UPI0013DC363F|nr:LXG domain-containing protein [Virgibacillus sp. YIM 98842]